MTDETPPDIPLWQLPPLDAAAFYNSRRRGTLIERMDIEFDEVSAERTVARMPVAGNTQPYGLLHGGASAVLAETVGSVASVMHAAGRAAVGIELNCTHHRAAREGFVVGTATPLHRGRTLTSYAVEIRSGDGALVCTARLTCMVRDAGPEAASS